MKRGVEDVSPYNYVDNGSNLNEKYLYIKVPAVLETSQSIELEYTVRNKNYVYKLR